MLPHDDYPLLSQIDSPADLRQLALEDLPSLCDEVRQFIIHSVSQTGGHLGASLGTVELTVALHYVFETPDDRLVWDVGHQTYGHKILTGRAKRMDSMRKRGGLAGFPKRSESEYDTFGVGHSSTSISAALGMALANKIKGDDRKVVAVIGDGALTAGMAFEALNHGGDTHANMLVVLNDNDMSISPNVGALNKYLAKLLTGSVMQSAREGTKSVLKNIPTLHRAAQKLEEHVKGIVVPATMFEELGFNYYGPVDGHDVINLVEVLRNMRKLNGPHFLHAVTQKGYGYHAAENDALALHAVTPFVPETGRAKAAKSSAVTFTQVFSDWVCDMARGDERLAAITPAMREGSGLVAFEKEFPARYFDVGIAEQHAVTLGAGMACEGLKPVVAIYSTFLQRGYDQLVHDVALQNLDVLFAVDRAGIVGPDGPTHAGAFDISFTRCLPNMLIMTPSDEAECRAMLSTGYQYTGPAMVRYPRGAGCGANVEADLNTLELGKANIVRQGKKVAILAFGTLLHNAKLAADTLDATLVDMRFVAPLDTDALKALSDSHSHFVSIEENTIAGGAGAAISEWLAAEQKCIPFLHLGLPLDLSEHGDRNALLASVGLDEQSILHSIQNFIG